MANQDILFPLLPRTTQVDVGDRHLRVKRIEKMPRADAVHEEDLGDATQQARVQDSMQHQDGSARKQPEQQAPQIHPDEDPVAEDPRKKHSEHNDDDHKGIHLDTYV